MSARARHAEEVRMMDALQGEDKAWGRYYAISKEWVTNWLQYVDAGEEDDA